MINWNVWEEGVSWEDRCRCIQVQKDELAKKVHGLEDALRQARTRCEHLESLVKQAARRHLLQQNQSSSLTDIDVIEEDILGTNYPIDCTAAGNIPINKHKYNRDEQDFIRELQKRNSTLQQNSNKVHQQLKSAIQLIKKYKKDVNTLRLRAISTTKRRAHGDGRKGSACQKSVGLYHDMESDIDDGLNEKENDPKLSRVDITNTVESKIKAEAEHERLLHELHQTKAAYQLLQTQYSVLDSKMGSQCEIQKQLIAKLEESNNYIQKLQKDIQASTREKSSAVKSFEIQIETMEDDIKMLRLQNTSLKDKLNNRTDVAVDRRKERNSCMISLDQHPSVYETSESLSPSSLLKQDCEGLRERSTEDQKQIVELQSKLNQSVLRIEELSATLEQLSFDLASSHKIKEIEDESHRKAEMALELSLSTQILAFQTLERDMRDKDIEVKVSFTRFQKTIEHLEATCALQQEHIKTLEESNASAKSREMVEEELKGRGEEELPIISCELYQVENNLESSNDLIIDSKTQEPISKDMCKGGYLKIKIIDADLSSIKQDFVVGSTLAGLDVLDFDSQATCIAIGQNPLYNFESVFPIQWGMIDCLSRYLNITTIDEMKTKERSNEKSRISKQNIFSPIAIEIYHVTDIQSISCIARCFPRIDWGKIGACNTDEKNKIWLMGSREYALVSPKDDANTVGSIRLSIGFQIDPDDSFLGI